MFEQEQYDVGCCMNKTYKTVAKLFKLMQMNWCGYGLKLSFSAKNPSTAPMNCTVREQVPKETVALITQQQIPRWRERVHFSAFAKMAKVVRKCKREHGVLLVLHLCLFVVS
jgi:hypothetical protein